MHPKELHFNFFSLTIFNLAKYSNHLISDLDVSIPKFSAGDFSQPDKLVFTFPFTVYCPVGVKQATKGMNSMKSSQFTNLHTEFPYTLLTHTSFVFTGSESSIWGAALYTILQREWSLTLQVKQLLRWIFSLFFCFVPSPLLVTLQKKNDNYELHFNLYKHNSHHIKGMEVWNVKVLQGWGRLNAGQKAERWTQPSFQKKTALKG